MRSLFIAAVLGACTQAMTVESNFNFMNFMSTHSKSYETVEEYKLRFTQWLETDALINEINAPESEWTHTAAHNFMSDLTDEEIHELMTLKTPPVAPEMRLVDELEEPVPNGSKDWRDSKCVNDVQNQGSCGSCWSFTSIAAMETSYCNASGKLLKLSEQQFVDCASQAPYNNLGCNGGFYDGAWNYAKVHGMESESDYPYEGKDKTCRYDASKGQVKVSDWHWVSSNSSAMMTALNKSAMSVAIYASDRTFSTYSSGIYTNPTCMTDVNHGVAVVGYSSNDQYFIVRNSWGTGWGESGYIRMAMADGKGTCGINQYPAYPDTAKWTN